MGIEQRYAQAKIEVAKVCADCGRDPSEVRLIAVSKTVGVEGVAEAFQAGARDFGENRPDRILEKAPQFPDARWHFIGNIQSRRIPDIVKNADLIHSLSHMHHGEKINQAAAALGKIQDVLIEVNVTGEASKSGVRPDEAFDVVSRLSAFPHVRVCGLMTMAPAGDLATADTAFADLAELARSIHASLDPKDAVHFTELSMGMSDDWRLAVARGATMVRIGRAIFSDSY